MNKTPQHVESSCSTCKGWICKNIDLDTPVCVRRSRFPHFDFEFNATYFDSAKWCLCDFKVKTINKELPSQSEIDLASVPKMKKKVKPSLENG